MAVCGLYTDILVQILEETFLLSVAGGGGFVLNAVKKQ